MQSVNYQGKVCELTKEGYQWLSGQDPCNTLYVYVKDGTGVEALRKDLEDVYGGDIMDSMNYREVAETTQKMYSGIVVAAAAVLFALTVLIVLFILYIIVKSMILQRRQEIGIYKALGYANWQLIAKIAGELLPTAFLGVIVSALSGLLYMPWVDQMIFESMGAMKNYFEVSILWLLLCAAVFMAVLAGICVVLAMPIKRITAYSLIKE